MTFGLLETARRLPVSDTGLWGTLPKEARERILANVFCVKCRDSVTITKQPRTKIPMQRAGVDGIKNRSFYSILSRLMKVLKWRYSFDSWS